jgi:hypothetical protein
MGLFGLRRGPTGKSASFSQTRIVCLLPRSGGSGNVAEGEVGGGEFFSEGVGRDDGFDDGGEAARRGGGRMGRPGG